MARLIVCCDGTWNTPDQREKVAGLPAPTNVVEVSAIALAPVRRARAANSARTTSPRRRHRGRLVGPPGRRRHGRGSRPERDRAPTAGSRCSYPCRADAIRPRSASAAAPIPRALIGGMISALRAARPWGVGERPAKGGSKAAEQVLDAYRARTAPVARPADAGASITAAPGEDPRKTDAGVPPRGLGHGRCRSASRTIWRCLSLLDDPAEA